MSVTPFDIKSAAIDGGFLGTPYSKLDCQALVEAVLTKAGLRIPNYRGSNHQWRELVYDRTEITTGQEVPCGVLVFKVRHDGGEVKRGYNDTMGNATHVGVAIGNGQVVDSSTGGVKIRSAANFTHWGRIKDVDYEKGSDTSNEGSDGTRPTAKDVIRNYLSIIRDNLSALEEFVNGTDLH